MTGMIKIKFPDGSQGDHKKGITPLEIVKGIGKKLEKDAIAAKVNGKVVDLSTPLEEDCDFKILTFEDKEGKQIFWHTTNHIMAHAVKNLFPDAKLGMGPAIEEGFYYDFDKEEPFTPEDLGRIEKEMEKIAKEDLPIERIDLKKEEAVKKNKELKEPYRVEFLENVHDKKIPFYKQGSFFDMCVGPHLTSTGKVKAFKLLKVAGAYWKGDAKNKQLQRIYGISFPSEKQLKEYVTLREEAEKRDHRKLGKELDIFSIHEEGPGFPFFLPNGMIIKNQLIDFWRKEHRKAGYTEIQTPMMLSKDLWVRSGHWDNYRENMYFTKIDENDYAIKPMNCPGGFLVYNEKVHSYRELPLRCGELGVVHRHELSGVLAGLFRVRVFTQDDAHIFMTPEQIEPEIASLMGLIDKFYNTFGFSYHVELSTKPAKAIGTDEQWKRAENSLKAALEKRKVNYKINPGDGAFYGPKIDFHLKDCIGRTWQCGTIQLDMAMPERFDLNYVAEDGKKHRPVMIHRVIYGSLERFMGILIEHYAGKFPLWIAPVQVTLQTVANRFDDFAKEVAKKMEAEGIRTDLDLRAESVSYKVREAQAKRIPIIATIGEKEVNEGVLAIRTLDNKVKFGVKIDDLIGLIKKNVEEKAQKFEI